MSLIVDEHRQYLADPHRLGAFERAISATVKPGDVVIDLGAGTGILGLLACRAGASRVYAIDDGGIIDLARSLCRANGFADRVVFIKELSTRVTLPEKANVVVADQIGRFGFEAGVWEYFTDARARLLAPGAATVPTRVQLRIAPVEAPELFDQIDFWSRRPAGFDLSAARVLAANTGYPARFAPEGLLADPATLADLDLAEAEPRSIGAEVECAARRSGTLHGLGGWFRAELAPGIFMSNGPGEPGRIDRLNVFLPIASPVAVEPGDRIRVRARIIPSQVMLRWQVTVSSASGSAKARFDHSTAEGMLLTAEDLARTRPDYVPRLTAWGEARRTLLELCDGRRSVAEIEAEVWRRHPALFTSAEAAGAFVAEVVTRYA